MEGSPDYVNLSSKIILCLVINLQKIQYFSKFLHLFKLLILFFPLQLILFCDKTIIISVVIVVIPNRKLLLKLNLKKRFIMFMINNNLRMKHIFNFFYNVNCISPK